MDDSRAGTLDGLKRQGMAGASIFKNRPPVDSAHVGVLGLCVIFRLRAARKGWGPSTTSQHEGGIPSLSRIDKTDLYECIVLAVLNEKQTIGFRDGSRSAMRNQKQAG